MNKRNYTKPRIRLQAISAEDTLLAGSPNEITSSESITYGGKDNSGTIVPSAKRYSLYDTPEDDIWGDRDEE